MYLWYKDEGHAKKAAENDGKGDEGITGVLLAGYHHGDGRGYQT